MKGQSSIPLIILVLSLIVVSSIGGYIYFTQTLPSKPKDEVPNTTKGCILGSYRCSGNNREICTSNGTWQFVENCTYGCSDGECILTQQCTEGFKDLYRCYGTYNRQRLYQYANCSTSYIDFENCTYGCVYDECLTYRNCTDGTLHNQCSSTKPKHCNNGKLIDKCSICGCPSNEVCNIFSYCVPYPSDLYVSSSDINFIPSNPKEFDDVNVTVTIHNIGTVIASCPFAELNGTINYWNITVSNSTYFNITKDEPIYTPPIPSDSSYTVNIQLGNLFNGIWNFQFTADFWRRGDHFWGCLNESNEYNNFAEKTIIVS